MKHSIASVIHYCSNDKRFLKKNIDEAKKFSQRIVITVCDHFFNGQKENRSALLQTYREFPDCQFIEFEYYRDRLYNRFLSNYSIRDREWGFFWHSTSRFIAAMMMPPSIEYVLFLDSDEIMDGNRFLRWLDRNEYRAFQGLRLRCYIYVHRADLRARALCNSALMARLENLDLDRMINIDDRHGIFNTIGEPKKKNLIDFDGIPFIHHYSWVRSQTECIKKSQCWGHRLDKNWALAIEKMFQNQENSDVMDLDLSFDPVEPFFDPMKVKLKKKRAISVTKPLNVIKVNDQMMFKKSIERICGPIHTLI